MPGPQKLLARQITDTKMYCFINAQFQYVLSRYQDYLVKFRNLSFLEHQEEEYSKQEQEKIEVITLKCSYDIDSVGGRVAY